MIALNEHEVLTKLYKLDAHFVLADSTKRPVHPAWQKQAPELSAVLAHHGLIGVIPASLGAIVLDVDSGGESAAAALIEQTNGFYHGTRRDDGFHIWQKRGEGVPGANAKWAFRGGDGDIRCNAGYVVLWEPMEVLNWIEGGKNGELTYELYRSLIGNVDPTALVQGNRNNALYAQVRDALRQNSDVELIHTAALAAGLGEREVKQTIDSAAKAHEKQRADIQLAMLSKDKRGLKAALKDMGISIRWNMRGMAQEWSVEQAEWGRMTDQTEAHFREQIAERYFAHQSQANRNANQPPTPLWFGAERFRTALNAILFERQVDPFTEWLESLPQWDTIKRIDKVLDVLFQWDKDEDALREWSSRLIFIGAVQRAYEPGCKLDEIPVLIGPQGCGKSVTLREVFPQTLQGFFSDGLRVADESKRRVEALLGRVLVEASEMAGVGRADIESLKAFITAQDDGTVRLAYARNVEPLPRRCVIVGTANDLALPNDPTGNRRFVALTITGRGLHPVEYMAKNREQLWAEALVRYHRGERANLPDELAKQQYVANEKNRIADESIETELAGYAIELDGLTIAEMRKVGYGAVTPDVRWESYSDHRIGKALRVLGFERKTVHKGGRQVRAWFLIKENDEPEANQGDLLNNIPF